MLGERLEGIHARDTAALQRRRRAGYPIGLGEPKAAFSSSALRPDRTGSLVLQHQPRTVATPRLILRAPRATDIEVLFEIQGDADAMRFTRWAPDRNATVRHLEAHAARFGTDGYAPWTAVLASESRVVGWGGLHRDPVAPHWGPEVSYFFHPAYWGRGLATELVAAALELAFRELDLPVVGAFTRPENRASARVLQKSGLSWRRHVPELERDQYELGATTWAHRRTG